MAIPFRQPVQMLTLDRNLYLFPRSVLEKSESLFTIFQYTRSASQTLFLKPDFQPQGVLGYGRTLIPYIQKARIHYIDTDRESNEFVMDTMYDKILTIENIEKFRTFAKKWSITIIPLEQDYRQLVEDYRNAGIDGPIQYTVIANDMQLEKPRKTSSRWPPDAERTIRDINTAFYWRKIEELRDFVKAWEQNRLKEHQMAWLNRELGLVSPLFFTKDGFVFKHIREMSYKHTESLDDIVGMRNAKTVGPMHGYRVYGHFALFVLEIYHDMEAGLQLFTCAHCGAMQRRTADSKRKTCRREESETCYRERQAARKRKSRQN